MFPLILTVLSIARLRTASTRGNIPSLGFEGQGLGFGFRVWAFGSFVRDFRV